MKSLEELTAAEDTRVIGGKTYTFTPLTMRDYGRIIKRIKAERGDPVEVARRLIEQLGQGLSAEDKKSIIDRAFTEGTKAKHVTAEELDTWKFSIPGFVFCYWLMLLPKHPELTEDDAQRLVEQLGEESMAERMAASDGLPEGNSESPTQETATT